MAPLTIKASLDDDTRRFTLEEPSLLELSRRAMSVFMIDPRLAIVIKHTDEAGVVHTITHTDQLRLLAVPIGNRPFKVIVEVFEPTVPAPVASTADNSPPPHVPIKDDVDYDSKRTGAPRSPTNNVDDYTYFKNEFHYHRLIVQTAVQETFRSVGRTMSKTFEQDSKMDKFLENSQKRLQVVREAIKTAFDDVKTKVPSSSEIAARVATALSELREYSAATIDSIRQYIESALQRLLSTRMNRVTDGNINEVVDEVIEDIQLQNAHVPSPAATAEPLPSPPAASSSSPLADNTAASSSGDLNSAAYPAVPAATTPGAYPAVPASEVAVSSPHSASIASFSSYSLVTAEEEKMAAHADEVAPGYAEVAFPVDPTEAALIEEAHTQTSQRSPSVMSFESLHDDLGPPSDDEFVYVESHGEETTRGGPYAHQLEALKSMGFANAERNASLLELYRGSVDDVVQALLQSSRAN